VDGTLVTRDKVLTEETNRWFGDGVVADPAQATNLEAGAHLANQVINFAQTDRARRNMLPGPRIGGRDG
jgi:hypothetical protein